MPGLHEIRADYDERTIVVYQAYSSAIADPALEARTFVAPFSFGRMTWIKPSFLWLMHRSGWGQRRGQERILAVRLTRSGWERALSLAVPTSHAPSLFPSPDDWEKAFQAAKVHLQWDTERSLRGAGLDHDSIQIGLSRQIIRDFVDHWIVDLEDLTGRTRKIHALLRAGKAERAKRLLPRERVYPLNAELSRRLLLSPPDS